MDLTFSERETGFRDELRAWLAMRDSRTPALVNPLHFGFDPTITPHEYDPEKAKKLLADAGHPNGFDITWNMTTSNIMPNYKSVFESMQQQLTKLYKQAAKAILTSYGHQ